MLEFWEVKELQLVLFQTRERKIEVYRVRDCSVGLTQNSLREQT